MLKTAFYLAANHAPVNQIALEGITETENPTEDTRLFISNENVLEAYDAFMTGAEGPAIRSASTQGASKVKKATKASRTRGLENARRLGEDMAVGTERRLKKLPFYFPEYRATGSRYTNDSPRIYSIPRRARQAVSRVPDLDLHRRAGRVLRRAGA